MSISQFLLPEFDREMATTRKALERVPDDKFDWKPHEKSTSMGDLATHIANLPTWAVSIFTEDSFDSAPDGKPLRMSALNSQEELLAFFDKNVTAAREALANINDEDLTKNWSLLSGGKIVFTKPKFDVYRDFVLNHMVHHRAQLGVYFRLNDIPVPQMYGPTADEN